MTKANSVERLVQKAALRILDLTDLGVDPSYQREVKSAHKRIVADFDEQALGIPLVGERSDGTLWIVDGQQRVVALKKLGKTKVRAEVFASEGPEHEARVFKLVNMNRVKLQAREQFKALLTAHDEEAWAVKETVEAAGFKISNKAGKRQEEANSKHLACVSTLVQCYRECGPEALRFALRAVDEAWPGDPLSVGGKLLNGLCLFHKAKGELLDVQKIITRMKQTTPYKVLYKAAQISMGSAGKGHSYAVAEVLEQLYKKRGPGRPARESE